MGGKKDDITIIIAFIQEKIYPKNLLKTNAFKNASLYDISDKFKRIPHKAFNSNNPNTTTITEEFIKNFENINLNFNSNQNSKKEEFLGSNKNEDLMCLDNSSLNLNNAFH